MTPAAIFNDVQRLDKEDTFTYACRINFPSTGVKKAW